MTPEELLAEYLARAQAAYNADAFLEALGLRRAWFEANCAGPDPLEDEVDSG